MAAENLSLLTSSCDESEDVETVVTKDVKCELVTRMRIIFVTVERHYVHEFPNRTAVFEVYRSHIQLKFARFSVTFTKHKYKA